MTARRRRPRYPEAVINNWLSEFECAVGVIAAYVGEDLGNKKVANALQKAAWAAEDELDARMHEITE